MSPAASAPYVGVPTYQLVFPNGYVTGIVAAGRFLSYGVNLTRFNTDVWSRLPSAAASDLRKLGKPVSPLRLTACAVRLSNTGPDLSMKRAAHTVMYTTQAP
jgi:hypothetical protein